MTKWENSIKTRLEEYESPLPDDSFVAFMSHSKRDTDVPSKQRFPWGWAIAAAFVALTAGLFFFPKPGVLKGGQEMALRSSLGHENSFSSADSSKVERQEIIEEDLKTTAVILQQIKKQKDNCSVSLVQRMEALEKTVPIEPHFVRGYIVNKPNTLYRPTHTPFASPSVVATTGVSYAAAGVTGTGLTGTLIAMLPQVLPSGITQSGSINTDAVSIGKHFPPVRIGLSFRFPFSNHFSITTGLDYSLYLSHFSPEGEGVNKQVVQYLGIPLRLDWTFVSGKYLSAYLGGGVNADFCLTATLDEYTLNKDTARLSLVAVGGIQWNLTNNVGLFLEPAISWQFPTSNSILSTYRSQSSLMFSVSTGIRFTFNKRNTQ